jgi:hypothetical protein
MKSPAPLLTINFFAHTRSRYISSTLGELAKIDKNLKRDISVNFLVNRHFGSNLRDAKSVLDKSGIRYNVLSNKRYLGKSVIVGNSKSPLSMKIDEDIFLTVANWEKFLVDSFNFDIGNSVLAPTVSSGIPGVEKFISNFLPQQLGEEYRAAFREISIPNAWGADYSGLREVYDPQNFEIFFAHVAKVNHHYKGVHPIRFDASIQAKLISDLFVHRSWETPISNKGFEKLEWSPYFCNSIFIIATKTYKDVVIGINKGEFFNDGFDEVALNQYLNLSGRNVYFNAGVAAIHPSYNTIGYQYESISDQFFATIRDENKLNLSKYEIS